MPSGNIRTLDGQIHFQESAVGVLFPTLDGQILRNLGQTTGAFSADSLTWMQPTTLQSAAELATLTTQPNLLTNPPGLPTGALEGLDTITPLLGSPGTPGVLIDAISDAGPGGAFELVSPINGHALTTDVLGNPRTDGNGRRTIGAIQMVFAPHLMSALSGDETALLDWTRPADPSPSKPITGYAVLYRVAASTGPYSRLDVSGASTTSVQITGLANGLEYEFQVVGVNADGDGPPSNRRNATPYGIVQPPSPSALAGDGAVALSWNVPDAGGYAITGYAVSFRRKGTQAWIPYEEVSSTSDSIVGLVNGVTYEFVVSTLTATVHSALSNPVEATPRRRALKPTPKPTAIATAGPGTPTPAPTPQVSLPPNVLSLPLSVRAGNRQALLSFQSSTLRGAEMYQVRYRPNASLRWTTVPKQSLNLTTRTVGGLQNGHLYDFQVLALDRRSVPVAASTIVSATPLGPKDLPLPEHRLAVGTIYLNIRDYPRTFTRDYFAHLFNTADGKVFKKCKFLTRAGHGRCVFRNLPQGTYGVYATAVRGVTPHRVRSQTLYVNLVDSSTVNFP